MAATGGDDDSSVANRRHGTTLELTGERTLPGIAAENYWFRRHEAVYRWVAERGGGGPVVEAGSGEGYGADLLRHTLGTQVLALDYDEMSCLHAAGTYPHLTVARANLAALPVRTASAGLVVSLQVIEHLWDLRGFLADAHRALRPGGGLVMSTPNRLTFSPGVGRGEKPTNPFHVEEFDDEQLAELLADAGFTDVRILGLHHAPRLQAEEARLGSIVTAQIAAITSGTWNDSLTEWVASVTVADFTVTRETHDCLDLVLTAVRP